MRNWNPSKQLLNRRLPSFLAYLWGIETYFWFAVVCRWQRFLAYLWGIETRRSRGSRAVGYSFLAYLWGIETPIVAVAVHLYPTFLAYLWGIETPYPGSNLRYYGPVFSVPMRNWNLTGPTPWSRQFLVFSVPMRNWNFLAGRRRQRQRPFLAYLWGIETSYTTDV